MSHLELFWHDAVQTIVGRYMMIAQYGERRRKGVVIVPEEENGVAGPRFRLCSRHLLILLLPETRLNIK